MAMLSVDSSISRRRLVVAPSRSESAVLMFGLGKQKKGARPLQARIPTPGSARYNPGMNEQSVWAAFGVAFAAFLSCGWECGSSIGSERWAKWTLATTIGLPVLYVASFGPACWVTSQDYIVGETVTTNRALIVYFPLARAIVNDPDTRYRWLVWWMTLGTPKGRTAIVPENASGTRFVTVDPADF